MNTSLNSVMLLTAVITMVAVVNECLGDGNIPEIMTKMKAVKDKIFNGYDKHIRPTEGNSNTTGVVLFLIPRQIIDVDETVGIFVLDSYLHMIWRDPRVTWTEEEYNGYLTFPQDMLWLPDISVYNSHSLNVNPQSETLLYCSNRGDIVWYPPFLTQTSCKSLIKAAYPYDEVECNITLGSWAHDGWAIEWTHTQIFGNQFENIHQRWELVTEKIDPFATRVIEGDLYHYLDFVFILRRRPLPEIEATRVPCILVMLITLSVFWLPPNSSKKILVLGFQFLVLTGLIAYVAWSTKSPAKVLFATTFLQSTMYIVAVTFLLQILVIFNLCSLSGPARPPPLAMQLLTGPLGKYACLRWPVDDHLPLDRVQLKEDASATLHSPSPRDDWMLFAAGLDRLFFVLASVAMIAVHHL